jgi:F-box interacting protein
VLLKSLWIAPVGVYYSADGALKIMFGTGSCKVFAVDSNGGGGDPEILFTPEDTIIGSCEDDCLPTIDLYEESLVPLGRTIEDMIFSSPTAAAWFNILKWLPARSLSELRLVCREWRGMIISDCFIRSHVVHANCLKRSPHIMFIIDPTFGHYVHLEECIRDPRLLMPFPPEFVVCSQPCHGLNVGNWSHANYFICNPIMRYFQRITFDDGDETFFAGRIGLGYNTEIDEHVLVHINYKEKNLETRSYELNCSKKHVNGEVWYPIDPPPRPVAAIQPTFVNGKIYWIVEPNLGPVSARCEIVAFNVKTEEFEVLQGPPCAHGVGHMTILELYGTLCISYSGQSRNTVDLWMMKDAGIWFMEYHIVLDELSEKAAPLAVDPTDGRILLNTGLSLGYYDPKTAAFETLIIADRIPDCPDDYEIYPIVCHESLVCPLQY